MKSYKQDGRCPVRAASNLSKANKNVLYDLSIYVNSNRDLSRVHYKAVPRNSNKYPPKKENKKFSCENEFWNDISWWTQ